MSSDPDEAFAANLEAWTQTMREVQLETILALARMGAALVKLRPQSPASDLLHLILELHSSLSEEPNLAPAHPTSIQ